jgi:hypothetical protein
MSNRSKKQEHEKLTNVVDKLSDQMLEYGPDTPEFEEALNRAEKVNKVRNASSGFARGITPDTAVLALANVAGIVIIVGWESRNVVTSFATKLLLPLKR